MRHHFDGHAIELIAEGTGNLDDLLTTSELAEWLRISSAWAEIGRSQGWGPPFVRLGPSRIRYRRGDVLRWLRERTFRHTNEYALQGRADAP